MSEAKQPTPEEREAFKKELRRIGETQYKLTLSGLEWWAVLVELQATRYRPQGLYTARVARKVLEKIAQVIANKGILKQMYEYDSDTHGRPSPTGKYVPAEPQQQPVDEGEPTFEFLADKSEGVVRVNFGRQISQISMSPTDARRVAEVLVSNAEECEKAVV